MEQRWKEIIAEHRASGLTAIRFCKEKNINKSKFYYWKKKLSGSRRVSEGFVSVNVPSRHQDTHFVTEYPNGVKLHFQSKLSQSLLRELIYVEPQQ